MKEKIKVLLPAIIESLKEMGRIGLLAVLPVAIEQLQTGSVNEKTLIVVGVVAVLKFIDKFLHERGKELENGNLTLGLTRF